MEGEGGGCQQVIQDTFSGLYTQDMVNTGRDQHHRIYSGDNFVVVCVSLIQHSCI